MKDRIERLLAIFGAVILLVAGIDAVSYAATGKSFLLGATNTATKVTTLKNTGAGAALNLQTKSTATAPLTTNAKGLVKNFNAEKVGGLTASQLQSAALAPMTFTFARTDAATTTVNLTNVTVPQALLSNAGAAPLTYQVTGDVTFPCDPSASTDQLDHYSVFLWPVDGSQNATFSNPVNVPLDSCGKPISVGQLTVTMTATTKLLVFAGGNSLGDLPYRPSTMTVNITGTPVRAAL